MKLVNVVVDDGMMVPGFERQTFVCSVCNDIERRFVFNNLGKEHCSAAASPPIATISENINNKEIEDDADTEAPSLTTASIENDQFPATQSLWKRIFAKMRR
jgi:hypothetical protein